MKRILATLAAAAVSITMAGAALAQVIDLTPASPQPSGLKQGLKMQVGLGKRPRTLSQAKGFLPDNPKSAKPIGKLQWPDKGRGATLFGTNAYEHVSAWFTGYIKFDAPGQYKLEWYANDGAEIWIGGQRVGKLDGINPCSSTGRPKVNVPKAGWYEFKAFYYQKEGTACFEGEWTPPGGKRGLIPDSAFGYK